MQRLPLHLLTPAQPVARKRSTAMARCGRIGLKSFGLLLVLGVVLTGTVPGHADSVPPMSSARLSDLLGPDDYLVIGDKVFDRFTYEMSGNMPPATNINVVGSLEDGKVKIRFQGAFMDVYDLVGGQTASDATISFRVTAGPGQLISGVLLAANTAVLGDPMTAQGSASVVETFLEDIADVSLGVFDIKPGSKLLMDSVEFPQHYQSLNVQKDILLSAATLGTLATVSFIDQTFTQVPEPAGLILLMTGLCGVLAFRWRRRRPR